MSQAYEMPRASEPTKTPVRRHGKGTCQRVAGVHVLSLAGTFAQMGEQHGALLAAEVARGPIPYYRQMVERLVGKSFGRRIVFTGDRIPAADLYRIGVLVACVPREQLMDEAMTMARKIAEKSPMAIRLAKKAYTVCENMPQRDGYRFEQDITVQLSFTEDAKEAQRAFVEKRKPVFKGR